MLSIKLQVFLTVVTILYFIIVLRAVRKEKMPIKSSVLWFLFGILMIVFILFPKVLVDFASIVGIKTISNLVLFAGVMCLLILSFDLYRIYNMEKKKNIALAQEIGIIKNELSKKK